MITSNMLQTNETPIKQETISNSIVNLSHVATQEHQQVDILTKLSIFLAHDGNEILIRQNIANMLFDTLAQYRARKNLDTFWVEIDNFFGSLLAYETVYDDYRFQTIEKSLQDLVRFPTLLAQFNKISNQRKQEIKRAREERIAEEKRARLEQEEKQRENNVLTNENWDKYLEDVKTGKFCQGSYDIYIGTYSGPTIPSSKPCNPLGFSLQKTTRSGKTY